MADCSKGVRTKWDSQIAGQRRVGSDREVEGGTRRGKNVVTVAAVIVPDMAIKESHIGSDLIFSWRGGDLSNESSSERLPLTQLHTDLFIIPDPRALLPTPHTTATTSTKPCSYTVSVAAKVERGPGKGSKALRSMLRIRRHAS